MHTLTKKSDFLQFFRSTVAGGAYDSDSSQAWPAPSKKVDALVLRKSATLPPDTFAQSVNPVVLSSAAPFPTPVRESAFELPRPAVVPGASAAWAPTLRKSPAAVLEGGASGARADVEFSRPPRFTEKLSMRHGQFCRSC